MSRIKLFSKQFCLAVFVLLVGLFLPLMVREWVSLHSEGLYDAKWHTTSMAELLQKDLSHHHPLTEVLSKLDETEHFTALDQHVRQKIGHLGLLQLKFYDLQGTIIYSDNHKLIGLRLKDNELFNEARQGVVAAKTLTPKEYQQEYEITSAVYMAEVSVPVRSESDGTVKYVMEVYYDYTPIQERMDTLLISNAISLSVIFVVVISLLAYFLKNKKFLENKVETLESVLPICQHCKKIRVETLGKPDVWHTVEIFFASRNKLKFSHGICGDCMSEHYPELNGRRQ